MPFLCPDCKSQTLKIGDTLELPPDAYDDEITLQTVACGRCGFQALAVYRESRRGALDAETWRHEGYRVAERDFQAIKAAMRRCPAPRDSRCQCPAHKRLGRKSGHRWDGLGQSDVNVLGAFDVR